VDNPLTQFFYSDAMFADRKHISVHAVMTLSMSASLGGYGRIGDLKGLAVELS
jgi:hypothetical protein